MNATELADERARRTEMKQLAADFHAFAGTGNLHLQVPLVLAAAGEKLGRLVSLIGTDAPAGLAGLAGKLHLQSGGATRPVYRERFARLCHALSRSKAMARGVEFPAKIQSADEARQALTAVAKWIERGLRESATAQAAGKQASR